MKNIYPNSFFLIGGFLGDYNEDLLCKQNTEIGVQLNSYRDVLNEYESTFESIKNNLKHGNIKSLINLKINNIIEYIKIVTFSIHMNAGYTTFEAILNNIPCTYFGTKWVDHFKKVNYVSKENYREPIYIEDENKIRYFSDNIYDKVTCEINFETIVDIVVNYDKLNNNVFGVSI